MGASIISGMGASPVFEPAEHDLDLVALPVEDFVVVDRDFAVGLGGDAGNDTAVGKGLAAQVES